MLGGMGAFLTEPDSSNPHSFPECRFRCVGSGWENDQRGLVARAASPAEHHFTRCGVFWLVRSECETTAPHDCEHNSSCFGGALDLWG